MGLRKKQKWKPSAQNCYSFENHPTEGKTAVIRSTIQVDGEYAGPRSSAVPCGWDTKEILHDLGFTENEMERLINDNATFQFNKD